MVEEIVEAKIKLRGRRQGRVVRGGKEGENSHAKKKETEPESLSRRA